MAKSSVSMKLLIDNQAKRVLFAEAGEDCVDFLFYRLSTPVANIISLLTNQGMVGSLANLYESVENLNESYIQPDQSKDTPRAGYASSVPLLLLTDVPTDGLKKFYRCPSNCGYRVSDDPRSLCPGCGSRISANAPYVAPLAAQQTSSNEGGFVKGVVTYMIMDNLVVKPMSTISSIALLNKFNVKEVGKLEEKVVELGMEEAVSLLKASLQSDKVLTDVFFKGKAAAA